MGLQKMLLFLLLVFFCFFFSHQLLSISSKILKGISMKIGTFASDKEVAVQRYVFLHRDKKIAKIYNWYNEQIISLGLKRQGVTPVGYLCFWLIICIPISVVIILFLNTTAFLSSLVYFFVFFIGTVITRVMVAEKMETRETQVMDAIDLIIPDIRSGVVNAITRYKDNFAPGVQNDFRAFLSNIHDRGYSFDDAMFILSDNMGVLFRDFAQKAIFYERVGDPEMVDIFADIIETNRLRRELRYTNKQAFLRLKTSFMLSTVIVCGYAGFVVMTDATSRAFFIDSIWGNLCLVVSIIIVISVLAYITTIRSKSI